MPAEIQNIVDLAVTVFAFGLVLALWLAGALLWFRQRSAQLQRVEERLGLHEEEAGEGRVLRLWKDGQEATTIVPGASRRWSLLDWLDRLRISAGWQVPVHTLIMGLLGVTTLLFIFALSLTGSALAGLGMMVTTLAIFWTYLNHRIGRQNALFERQLADALDLAARSLRAGHPLIGAFRLVSEEIGPPVSPVFAEICQQQSMGISFENALRNAVARTGSVDMKLCATSVIIQLRSGGNLADMMDRVATVIRDRIRLNGRMRSLTAQTQLSKRVLIVLPIALFAVLSLLRPEYMEPFRTTSSGKVLLVGGGVSLLLGAWMMNRMAVLRY